MKEFYLYILSNQKRGTLYIGITNDLYRRILEHKEGKVQGFTNRYKVNRLVYFESSTNINDVIEAEKRIKKWNRIWKIRLIEESNPNWKDLHEEIKN